MILDKLHATATGLDKLPAWFLRLSAPVFYKPLARLLNLSIVTATMPRIGCVNGDWLSQWEMVIFDHPHRIETPQPITTKISHRWLRRQPLRLCQIRCISVHRGLLGTWPTGQTRPRIFTHDGSNDADSRKDVPFLGIFHIAPHLGGRFQPKFAQW